MIRFKQERDKHLIWGLHPMLIMIFLDMSEFAKTEHGIDLMITATSSTESEDMLLGRKSTAHLERRALDIRSKDINVGITTSIVDYINSKEEYSKYRYTSFSGVERLAFVHTVPGSAEHIHLALHKDFANF